MDIVYLPSTARIGRYNKKNGKHKTEENLQYKIEVSISYTYFLIGSI